MIKTFEQFVSAKYGKPVNEGFQSGKLRAIIKQHGLPKNNWDKKMLYDLQDNEIVDVVDNREEYDKKYDDARKPYKDEETFMIELEDGSCVVISNLGILKQYLSKDWEMRQVIDKRHSERHKGNLGKHGGDDIHNKHLEKVEEIDRKRFAATLKPYTQEIVDEVESRLQDMDLSDLENESGTQEIEFEIDLGGNEYTINMQYKVEFYNERKKYGAVYYDAEYNLIEFYIFKGFYDTYANDVDLGITKKTHKNLFQTFTQEIEGKVYDYYEYYGVSRSDFF